MKARMTVFAVVVAAALTAAPLGTEFTYQGVLTDAGAPAAGVFDFRFLLYDADVGGSQVGGIVFVEDIAVSDGRMTTQLDFGSVFDGTALWLEVGVRDGGSTGGYMVLSPRQELTAAPFAQHAATADAATTAASATTAGHATTADTATTAGSATTAGDADNLDSQDGSYYLTWSNFIGIPGDLADGDDDTLADLSCGADEIARWNGSAWNCSSDDDTPYARTYVFGPVGTPTQNGTALRTAISSLPHPSSQEESILVVLEPGVYDLGASVLAIPQDWTAIEGSGESQTLVTSEGCGSGVIRASGNHFGLHRISLENTCGGLSGIALTIEGSGAVVDHGRFSATGAAGSNNTVLVTPTGTHLKIANATIKAENGANSNTGIHNSAENGEFNNVTIEATGGSSRAAAIYNFGGSMSVRRSTLKASGSSGLSVAFQAALGEFTLDDVIAEAELGPGNTIGIDIDYANGVLNNVRTQGNTAIDLLSAAPDLTIRMRNVEAEGYGKAILCDIGNSGATLTLDIDDSWIHGTSSYGVENVPGADECDISIRGSYVMGTPFGVSGSASCVAVWDKFSFYPSYCPSAP